MGIAFQLFHFLGQLHYPQRTVDIDVYCVIQSRVKINASCAIDDHMAILNELGLRLFV